MYKIIGADGAQYGPITVEQLRQWIAEGRVNGQTLVQPDVGGEWKPLSAYPELADLLAAAPAAPPAPTLPTAPTNAGPLAGPPVYTVDASRQVQGPAIGLIITAVLGLLSAFVGLAFQIFGVAFGPAMRRGNEQFEQFLNYSAGGFGVLQSLLHLALGGVILYGALRMMKLENYNLALISAVLALIPCVSPCCLLGLPIGIWALVILLKPEVKALFH